MEEANRNWSSFLLQEDGIVIKNRVRTMNTTSRPTAAAALKRNPDAARYSEFSSPPSVPDEYSMGGERMRRQGQQQPLLQGGGGMQGGKHQDAVGTDRGMRFREEREAGDGYRGRPIQLSQASRDGAPRASPELLSWALVAGGALAAAAAIVGRRRRAPEEQQQQQPWQGKGQRQGQHGGIGMAEGSDASRPSFCRSSRGYSNAVGSAWMSGEEVESAARRSRMTTMSGHGSSASPYVTPASSRASSSSQNVPKPSRNNATTAATATANAIAAAAPAVAAAAAAGSAAEKKAKRTPSYQNNRAAAGESSGVTAAESQRRPEKRDAGGDQGKGSVENAAVEEAGRGKVPRTNPRVEYRRGFPETNGREGKGGIMAIGDEGGSIWQENTGGAGGWMEEAQSKGQELFQLDCQREGATLPFRFSAGSTGASRLSSSGSHEPFAALPSNAAAVTAAASAAAHNFRREEVSRLRAQVRRRDQMLLDMQARMIEQQKAAEVNLERIGELEGMLDVERSVRGEVEEELRRLREEVGRSVERERGWERERFRLQGVIESLELDLLRQERESQGGVREARDSGEKEVLGFIVGEMGGEVVENVRGEMGETGDGEEMVMLSRQQMEDVRKLLEDFRSMERAKEEAERVMEGLMLEHLAAVEECGQLRKGLEKLQESFQVDVHEQVLEAGDDIQKEEVTGFVAMVAEATQQKQQQQQEEEEEAEEEERDLCGGQKMAEQDQIGELAADEGEGHRLEEAAMIATGESATCFGWRRDIERMLTEQDSEMGFDAGGLEVGDVDNDDDGGVGMERAEDEEEEDSDDDDEEEFERKAAAQSLFSALESMQKGALKPLPAAFASAVTADGDAAAAGDTAADKPQSEIAAKGNTKPAETSCTTAGGSVVDDASSNTSACSTHPDQMEELTSMLERFVIDMPRPSLPLATRLGISSPQLSDSSSSRGSSSALTNLSCSPSPKKAQKTSASAAAPAGDRRPDSSPSFALPKRQPHVLGLEMVPPAFSFHNPPSAPSFSASAPAIPAEDLELTPRLEEEPTSLESDDPRRSMENPTAVVTVGMVMMEDRVPQPFSEGKVEKWDLPSKAFEGIHWEGTGKAVGEKNAPHWKLQWGAENEKVVSPLASEDFAFGACGEAKNMGGWRIQIPDDGAEDAEPFVFGQQHQFGYTLASNVRTEIAPEIAPGIARFGSRTAFGSVSALHALPSERQGSPMYLSRATSRWGTQKNKGSRGRVERTLSQRHSQGVDDYDAVGGGSERGIENVGGGRGRFKNERRAARRIGRALFGGEGDEEREFAEMGSTREVHEGRAAGRELRREKRREVVEAQVGRKGKKEVDFNGENSEITIDASFDALSRESNRNARRDRQGRFVFCGEKGGGWKWDGGDSFGQRSSKLPKAARYEGDLLGEKGSSLKGFPKEDELEKTVEVGFVMGRGDGGKSNGRTNGRPRSSPHGHMKVKYGRPI